MTQANNIQNWARIAKVLSGNANHDEMEAHQLWLNESETNRADVAKAKAVWEQANMASAAKVDVNKAWHMVETKARIKHAGIFRISPRTFTSLTKIAALLAVIAGLWLVYQQLGKSVTKSSFDAVAQVSLTDGSRIDMNKHSSLQYPKKFSGSTREVFLNGEAFFKITRNPLKPFIIHTQSADIKVLGTSFAVKTGTNGQLDVIVNTGTVSVTATATKKIVVLQKNERVRYSTASKTLVTSVNTDSNYVSWMTHKFIFRETSLAVVLKQLSETYETSISVSDTALYNYKLTATYDKLSINEILNLLDLTFGFTTQYTDNKYVIAFRKQ